MAWADRSGPMPSPPDRGDPTPDPLVERDGPVLTLAPSRPGRRIALSVELDGQRAIASDAAGKPVLSISPYPSPSIVASRVGGQDDPMQGWYSARAMIDSRASAIDTRSGVSRVARGIRLSRSYVRLCRNPISPLLALGVLSVATTASAATITTTWVRFEPGSPCAHANHWFAVYPDPPCQTAGDNWTAGIPDNSGSETYDVVIDLSPHTNGVTLAMQITGAATATIDSLTLGATEASTILAIGGNATLILDGGPLTNHGEIQLGPGFSNAILRLHGGQTISGSGRISMESGVSPAQLFSDGSVLTHASGHTIQGSGWLLGDTGGMVNQGFVIANLPAAVLRVDPDANGFTNQGTTQADGGLLWLEDGTFTNTGHTIEALNGGTVQIRNLAAVVGGTLDASAGGQLETSGGGSPGATLDGVTLASDLQQHNSNALTVRNGLTNEGTWTLGEQADVTFDGTQILAGSGRMQMHASAIEVFGTGTLTNGPGHTIEGAAAFDVVIHNQGRVEADVNGGSLFVPTGSVNDGLLAARDGGTIGAFALADLVLTGSGSWLADGGTISILGLSGPGVTTTGDITLQNGSLLDLFFNTQIMSGAKLALDDSSSIVVNVFGGGIVLSEDLSFALTDEANWTWTSSSYLQMNGGVGASPASPDGWASLEVGGSDLGTDPANHVGAPAGFGNNFELAELVIGPGAHVSLVDALDNGNRGASHGFPEALYVNTLTFADGAGQLNLNGLHLYFNTLNGSASQIVNAPFAVPSLSPLATALLGALLGLVAWRRLSRSSE